MKLTQEICDAIPDENWIAFMKKEYNHECGEPSYFMIGDAAENGFLEYKTFCSKLNQTYVDVTETQFKRIKEGYYLPGFVIKYPLYKEGDKLKDNEYLLKLRKTDKPVTGFMTKLNKDGTIPVKFKDWDKWDEESFPIYIITEEFSNGWKIDSWRFGESRNWATMIHPNGFTVEIHLKELLNIIKEHTIVKGELKGNFYWEKSKLISK